MNYKTLLRILSLVESMIIVASPFVLLIWHYSSESPNTSSITYTTPSNITYTEPARRPRVEDKLIDIVDLIKEHEGSVMKNGVHVPYRCTAGKLTVGFGHNLDDCGISEELAEALLEDDIFDCENDLRKIFGSLFVMDDDIRLVLTDMRFALGASGFRKFKGVIRAAKAADRRGMAVEMRDSKWYRGVGKNRINDLINILENN